ncbi:MAG: AAA family ATPase [Lewinellaceae bacterium]|nr:AAA family ATPase [Phaeodactylibacter sp.]MCB9036879.1 AAA family ATPase [Lewinellaceae bacterium]
MKNKLIGRKKEQEILKKALVSDEPEMVAVIGRRRVGKTFLIRAVYKERIDLEFTGVQNASRKEQLDSFHFILKRYAEQDTVLSVPKNWLEAFHQLITVLEEKNKSKKKKVLFFDELPWLATKKSGFLKALGFFWNNWASKNNIVVIICGSAASWMIQKVVKDKGGLHNRITKRINLKPFNLAETEAFLLSKNLNLNRYHIILIYMIMGGVPHYLREVKPGKSAVQNIDDICFSEDGLLADEFSSLYPALFEHSENHVAIIRALAKKWKGLTRAEIINSSNLPDGGGTTKVLNELIHSGFISSYFPFGKKRKDMLYRLTDEYSLFYLHFIEKGRRNVKGAWKALSQTSTFKSWSGYAFESLCLKHIEQIKKALEIGGIYSESSSFSYTGNEYLPGVQIDLLIDRNDQVINLCEMKFQQREFSVTKDYAEQLRKKISVFSEISKTKKQIFLTLITTFGTIENKHSLGLIDNDLTMDVLFG